jgi:DNA-binding LacI/PurR family transcriptional regulator
MTKLSDIALACDVDISTVSRALQNDPRVKSETKEIILKKAEELKYKPNFAARNLARGKTDAIVLLLPSINDRWSIEVAQNSSKNLMAANKDLILLMHHENLDTYQRMLERIDQSYCDGAIILPSNKELEKDLFIKNMPLNVPVIFVDRWIEGFNVPVVTNDNLFSSATLTEKLINEGCTIIINGFSKNNEVTRERHRGVTIAVKKSGVTEIPMEEVKNINFLGQKIGFISTSQGNILQAAKENLKLMSENQIYFACFEEWRSEPAPAIKVFVCIQDFKSIIERALLELLNLKENRNSSEIIRIKPKEFFVIEKTF